MSVTFALLCYNQEKFIREALRGAFRQDYQPLEILISDDHSTDASFDILREEVANYSGPRTVRLVRNGENLGLRISPEPPRRPAASSLSERPSGRP